MPRQLHLFTILTFILSFEAVGSANAQPSASWSNAEFQVDFSEWKEKPEQRKANNDIFSQIPSMTNEIFAFYRGAGFLPPLLTEFADEKNNIKYFPITLVEEEGGSSAAYTFPRCSKYDVPNLDTDRGIELNRRVFDELYTGGKTPSADMKGHYLDRLYQSLAHEIFHGIQHAYEEKYRWVRQCADREENGYLPVLEGMAEAAGVLAMLARKPDHYDNKTLGTTGPYADDLANQVGLFPYFCGEFLKADTDKVKKRCGGGHLLSYRLSSFWRYLAEKYGPGASPQDHVKAFQVFMGMEMHEEPSLARRYVWLDKAMRQLTDGDTLYLVYPEFLSELASYAGPGSKYKKFDQQIWLTRLFGTACTDPISLEGLGATKNIRLDTENNFLRPMGARCVFLEWIAMPPPFNIDIEARLPDKDYIDQLQLGGSEYKSAGADDRCYPVLKEMAGGDQGNRRSLECVYGKWFGSISKGSEDTPYAKRWITMSGDKEPGGMVRFFARGPGSDGSARFIIVNIDDAETEKTKPIPPLNDEEIPEKDESLLSFSVHQTIGFDGRKYRPADGETGLIPNPADMLAQVSNGPDRYQFYGVKNFDYIQAGPSKLATIAVASTGENGPNYSVMAMNEDGVDFGYTGSLAGIVTRNLPPGDPGQTAISIMCAVGKGSDKPPPIGAIVRSDEDQLHVKVDTDLCVIKNDGSVEVADHVAADIYLPFGRRYYADTAPRDIITPGLEIYIDEYLEDVERAGLPLPSGVAPGGGPDNPNNPSSPPANNSQSSNTTGVVCLCTCGEKQELQTLADSGDPALLLQSKNLNKLMMCPMQCSSEYKSCDD